MYLRRLLLLNSGPTERCAIELPFHDDGRPKPVLVVGGNGAGKTNFLSVIADGLMELAAVHFQDVLPPKGLGHSFYRTAGGRTRRSGANYDLTALSFRHEDKDIYFRSQSGDVLFDELAADLAHFGPLNADRRSQEAKLTSKPSRELAESIFRSGVHTFFPSWRNEVPHWRNDPALEADPALEPRPTFSSSLDKPLVIEQGLRSLKPWIIDIILDQSIDATDVVGLLVPERRSALGPMLTQRLQLMQAIASLNSIIGVILGRPDARIIRSLRIHGDRRIQIYFGAAEGLANLDSLSAGQSTLLNIFGNALRLGTSTLAIATPASATGVVLVDEIDAHLHADLQYEGLPKLMAMFPRVQFIVTCHSPLLPLGMDKQLGTDGYQILEMPSGTQISSERYSEFLRSFEIYQATKAFEERLKELGTGGKPLVIGEGETDAMYLTAAAELLGYTELLDQVEFKWVGELDTSGRKINGQDQLKKTVEIYRATLALLNRPILCLFDQKSPEQIKVRPFTEGKLSLRVLPLVPDHPHANDGPENLLPPEIFSDEFYVSKPMLSGTTKMERKELKKGDFARHVCGVLRNPVHFERFRAVLDECRKLLLPNTAPAATVDTVGASQSALGEGGGGPSLNSQD